MQRLSGWRIADARRAKMFVKVLAAESIYALRTVLRRWEVKLDPRVASVSTQKSRNARQQLDQASQLGMDAARIGLVGALRVSIFDESLESLDWNDVSLLERTRASQALWRTARKAHPRIALRALEELDYFIPNDVRERIGGIRCGRIPATDGGIAGIKYWALPYLVKWLRDNHYPAEKPHPAVQEIGKIRDPSTLPYLRKLVQLGPATEHAQLIQAAREAIREMERAIIAGID